MWGRLLFGGAALGAYGWRVEDPKASYNFFYDASEWLTSLVLTGEGLAGYARNFVNLVLVDQLDGFLLGMAFMALISVVLWPFRAAGRAGAKGLRRAFGAGRRAPPQKMETEWRDGPARVVLRERRNR